VQRVATIGVDCSGKVDALPMYMAAARGDRTNVVLVTRIPIPVRRSRRDWRFRAYACYAFKAIKPLFQTNPMDRVLLDRDFDPEGLQRVQRYLEHLLRYYFALPPANLVEAGDDQDKPVQEADALSKRARKGGARIGWHNPDISRELKLLPTRF
jgi:hypothetical protein